MPAPEKAPTRSYLPLEEEIALVQAKYPGYVVRATHGGTVIELTPPDPRMVAVSRTMGARATKDVLPRSAT